MAERQEAYEEKIRDLESKIFLLERQNKEKDIYRNKNKIFIKTEVEPDKINEYSLFYNPKEKTKNVHKNLT